MPSGDDFLADFSLALRVNALCTEYFAWSTKVYKSCHYVAWGEK